MPALVKILIANAGVLLHLAVKIFDYAVSRKQKQVDCGKKKDGKPD